MQPPARRTAHPAMLGRFIVEDENRDYSLTAFDSRQKGSLIGKAQVTAEPEDLGHMTALSYGAACE